MFSTREADVLAAQPRFAVERGIELSLSDVNNEHLE